MLRMASGPLATGPLIQINNPATRNKSCRVASVGVFRYGPGSSIVFGRSRIPGCLSFTLLMLWPHSVHGPRYREFECLRMAIVGRAASHFKSMSDGENRIHVCFNGSLTSDIHAALPQVTATNGSLKSALAQRFSRKDTHTEPSLVPTCRPLAPGVPFSAKEKTKASDNEEE